MQHITIIYGIEKIVIDEDVKLTRTGEKLAQTLDGNDGSLQGHLCKTQE